LRWNCLLQNVIGGKREGAEVTGSEEEDVSSYWMTFRKREGARN
jgi:hypothetical protein